MDPQIASRLQAASIQLLPFLMAVVFHEVAHGWVAKLWGDRTAQDQGRLTLNPIPHIDPIGTLLFPIMNMVTGIPLFIGWAKPVPINPNRFRKYRPGLFFVSLAGPASNVVMAVFFAFVGILTLKYTTESFVFHDALQQMAYAGVFINFALALFNLLPIPPLDGGRVIESILSHEHARTFATFERFSFFILLGLFITGIIGRILQGPVEYLSYGVLNFVGSLLGVVA